MPTTGSPVSSTGVQPYCGAVGVNHGSTLLFTNGSSAHSETSWLRAWMSCSAQSVPPFARAKTPGEVYDANAYVCTVWLPCQCVDPVPWPWTSLAPWNPITQQLFGSPPM